MPLLPLGSLGSPGRIGDVQIDVITSISSPVRFDRTTTRLESGAPITRHRQRLAQQIVMEVLITDANPYALALPPLIWELFHSIRTRERLLRLQDTGEELDVFDGREFRRTPAGRTVWVIDEIDDTLEPGKDGTWAATITLGESERAETLFTSALPNVDPSLADAVGGVSEGGRQSATTADAGTTAAVVGGLS